MNAKANAQLRTTIDWNQAVIGLLGLLFLLTGLAQLLAPRWFFDSIGTFAPFNRHYTGDLGAFTAPLGLGLLLSLRRLRENLLLVLVGAAGSTLHLFNHLYDDLMAGSWSVQHALGETIPLALTAMLLWRVWARLRAPS
jgi:hypothetical protein